MDTPCQDGVFAGKFSKFGSTSAQLWRKGLLYSCHGYKTKWESKWRLLIFSTPISKVMFQTQQIAEDSSRFVINEPGNNDISRFKN